VVAGSTEKNEPAGLSTPKVVGSRIVTVIGSWLQLPEQKGLGLIAPASGSAARERSRTCGRTGLASGCKTLHPPRPSGRSPHRPLIFLGKKFKIEQLKVQSGRVGGEGCERFGRGSSFRMQTRRDPRGGAWNGMEATDQGRSGHGVLCPYGIERGRREKKKRALPIGPSEQNHFDDTLAGS
jgi:hypothetical protein